MIRRNRVAWIATGWGLIAILAALVAVLVATGMFATWAWSWSADLGKEIAAVTMVLTAATLGMAVLAGLIAMAAYWVAIQKPRLELEVSVPSAGYAILHDRKRGAGAERVVWVAFKVQVRLWNRSSYSGRNPAVRLEFRGFNTFSPDDDANNGRWSRVPPPKSGLYDVYQWDGGADLSIHGPDWYRDLPVFSVKDSAIKPGTTPSVVVTAVVDGDSTSHSEDLSSHTRERSEQPRRIAGYLDPAEPHSGPWKDTGPRL